jgi:hypothetical protein
MYLSRAPRVALSGGARHCCRRAASTCPHRRIERFSNCILCMCERERTWGQPWTLCMTRKEGRDYTKPKSCQYTGVCICVLMTHTYTLTLSLSDTHTHTDTHTYIVRHFEDECALDCVNADDVTTMRQSQRAALLRLRCHVTYKKTLGCRHTAAPRGLLSMHSYRCVCVHVYVCMSLSLSLLHECVCACRVASGVVRLRHMRTHAFSHTHAHTHTHTVSHLHTHTLSLSLLLSLCLHIVHGQAYVTAAREASVRHKGHVRSQSSPHNRRCRRNCPPNTKIDTQIEKVTEIGVAYDSVRERERECVCARAMTKEQTHMHAAYLFLSVSVVCSIRPSSPSLSLSLSCACVYIRISGMPGPPLGPW